MRGVRVAEDYHVCDQVDMLGIGPCGAAVQLRWGYPHRQSVLLRVTALHSSQPYPPLANLKPQVTAADCGVTHHCIKEKPSTDVRRANRRTLQILQRVLLPHVK